MISISGIYIIINFPYNNFYFFFMGNTIDTNRIAKVPFHSFRKLSYVLVLAFDKLPPNLFAVLVGENTFFVSLGQVAEQVETVGGHIL